MFMPEGMSRKSCRRLKKLMDKCQLTPYGLGQLAGVDASHIYRIVNGERRPSRSTMLAMAQALHEYSSLITERDINNLIKYSGFPPPRRFPE